MTIYTAYNVTIKGNSQMVIVNEDITKAWPFHVGSYTAEEWAAAAKLSFIDYYFPYCEEDGDLTPALGAIHENGVVVWQVEV